MGKPHDFFSALKARLGRKPDKRFDQAFWQKFHSEFPKEKKPALYWRIALPFAALFIAIGLWWQISRPTDFSPAPLAELSTIESILENQELLENYELFVLTQEEWELLLEDNDEES